MTFSFSFLIHTIKSWCFTGPLYPFFEKVEKVIKCIFSPFQNLRKNNRTIAKVSVYNTCDICDNSNCILHQKKKKCK